MGTIPDTLLNQGRRHPTRDDDPRHLYHNVIVVLDAARGINNGGPALWAFLFDRIRPRPGERVLHVGCGTGYYSAVLAELVGVEGRVQALEIEPDLAERARPALAPWRMVEVGAADGFEVEVAPRDVVVVNAGVSHPAAAWLESLVPGGRLLLPLTDPRGRGAFLPVTRVESGFAATFVCRVGIVTSHALEPAAALRFGAALGGPDPPLPAVRALHRGHAPDPGTCWYAGPGFWLSIEAP